MVLVLVLTPLLFKEGWQAKPDGVVSWGYFTSGTVFFMSSITFDTHKFVRKLQEAGFNEKQAEGLTEAMRAAIDESELATRRDLKEMELRLDTRFEALKGDISLIKWMMGALIAMAVANFSKQFF